MSLVHDKKNTPTRPAVKRTASSVRSGEVDLSHIFESLLPTASVMQQLVPYASQIATLKRNKVSMKLLAEKLIAEGKLDIKVGLLTEALEQFGEKPAATRVPAARRPPIPASDIQEAVERVMKSMRIKRFTVRDREVIDAVVAAIPALASYPRHERNRKIVDAFIKRTTGPIVVRKNRRNQREIAFAA